LEAGWARAQTFIHRIRPSTLAQHAATQTTERVEPDLQAPPDFPEEQAPSASVTDYGNWWHGLMEHTPWMSGPDAWAAHWEKHLDASPDPTRARAEVARLKVSPLATRLAEPGWEVTTEMPFLWTEPKGASAFDGCIDFAAWNASTQRWLVVDWKTDATEGDAGAALRRRYAAQVAIYARALAAVYGAPVETFLYGTRTGVLTEIPA
jgi:ATP-dependent exoDNAse (exonuclease V) beta subunit